MKKALVTGSSGFVGRHFVKFLTSCGWFVNGWDLDNGHDCLTLFNGKYDYGARWDLVVHAAANQPHRVAIDGNPSSFVANARLDATMFDWAIRTRQRRVLYVSSSAAYPIAYQTDPQTWNASPAWLSEDDINLKEAYEPDASYGWTKLTGERLAEAARRAGVPVTVVRPFSGYGEDQGEDWPFGAFVARASRREDPFVIWGDGTQVRDWVHVDDLVQAAMAIIESDTTEPVNICTGVGTSMKDLVSKICQAKGYSPNIEFLTDKPSGVSYRVGNPTRLHQFYVPRISIEEGVMRAVKPL